MTCNRFNQSLFLPGLALLVMVLLFSCGHQQRPSNEGEAVEEPYVFQPPAWSYDAVIYEVNVRQYTPEGTFKAFEAHLPRLKELGVDILWLMPVHPISEKNRKGPLGSYYAVQDYKKINPEFGTMDDFRSLVEKAHGMGFYVILDWVANHTGWDNPWIFDHPEWYTHDSTGNIIYPSDWTDVADLNYDNADMRAAMTDALKFWVQEADIDGYRCDVAADVPTDFWNDVRFELDRIKLVFMLAEAEKPEHHEKAFDMSYSWELHGLFNAVAQGKKNVTDLDNYFIKHDTTFPSSAYRMNFITNHDENSWHGSVNERMGKAGPVFAVLSYTLPGMPLIYSGQEAGLDKRLAFFSKDTIHWDYESPLIGFYTTLNRMKKENQALWNGNYGGGMERIMTSVNEKVFAFARQKDDNTILVVTNLSDQNISIVLAAEEIPAGQYADVFSGAVMSLPDNNGLELAPWAYLVLAK
jgi:glycosidase